jgi:general stress protein YciG
MPNNNPHGHNQYTKRDQTSKPTQPGQGGEHKGGEHKGGEHAGTRPAEPSHSGTDSSTAAAPAAQPAQSGISRRGFASMDQATQREIASKGGHAQGRANNPGNFANDREKAREAGRKGGEAHGTNRQ